MDYPPIKKINNISTPRAYSTMSAPYHDITAYTIHGTYLIAISKFPVCNTNVMNGELYFNGTSRYSKNER